MKLSTRVVLTSIALIAAVVGCSSSGRKAGAPATGARSVEQLAWDAIASGAPVIDVRTEAEFRQGHLADAANIPYDEIVSRLNELPSDRSRPIVLYCRTGRRSGIARQSLEQLGFTNVINAGGYEAMRRAQPDGGKTGTGE